MESRIPHPASFLVAALVVAAVAGSGVRADEGDQSAATTTTAAATTTSAATIDTPSFEAARTAYHRGGDAIPMLRAVASAEGVDGLIRRDALHLLGRALNDAELWDKAATVWTEVLALSEARTTRSSLLDVVRYELARALVKTGEGERARTLLRRVARDPHTALAEQAMKLRAESYLTDGEPGKARRTYQAMLERWPDAPATREWHLGIGHAELSLGRKRSAADVLRLLVEGWPESRAGLEARTLLQSLGDEGVRNAGVASRQPTLDELEHLVDERRFDEAEGALNAALERARERGLRSTERRCMRLLLRMYWETYQWAQALETSAWLAAKKVTDSDGDPVALSAYRTAIAHGYLGQFDKARRVYLKKYRYNRGRAYWTAIGDLDFYFGRYEQAYDAYEKAQRARRRRAKRQPTKKMVWCLIRSGQGERAAELLRDAGRSRSRSRLYERYWYARAQHMAGKQDEARQVFANLVEDAPYEYYGIQAWSRLAEMDDAQIVKAHRAAGLPSTVAWSAASLEGVWDKAPKRAPQHEIERALENFAGEWAAWVPEATRARELGRLGFIGDAIGELRVVDMDLRSAIAGGSKALRNRGRVDLLDNRRNRRARGGASLKIGARRDSKEARAFRARRVKIRAALRVVQRALAEPYGLRRSVYEQGRMTSTPSNGDGELVWSDAYPLAWPELVSTFSGQFDVPIYYIYAIMTVESAFHPHPISVANAYGLLQVIPRTGRRISSELGYTEFSPELLLKPNVSIYYGTYYLASVRAKFRGQEMLAAAAYNGGPHRVAAWLAARGSVGDMDMFVEEIPFTQSRKYAKTVIKNIARFRATYHDESHTYVSNHLNADCLPQPNY